MTLCVEGGSNLMPKLRRVTRRHFKLKVEPVVIMMNTYNYTHGYYMWVYTLQMGIGNYMHGCYI